MSRESYAERTVMNGNASRGRPVDRVTVPEAAEMMGVTQSAIRKRVQRGTILWDKDSEGRIFVYVDPSETSPETRRDKTQDTVSGQSPDELLEAYRDQVEFLRRELERKDTLLMSLMQRIPELEAPSEPSGAPEPASEEPYSTHAPPTPERPVSGEQEPSERRSWWREFFGIK
jgi:hypothetical protein